MIAVCVRDANIPFIYCDHGIVPYTLPINCWQAQAPSTDVDHNIPQVQQWSKAYTHIIIIFP